MAAASAEGVNPGIECYPALHRLKATDRAGDGPERIRELGARECVRLAVERGDEELVRSAASVRGEYDNAGLLDHNPCTAGPLFEDDRAERTVASHPRTLLGQRWWLLGEPHELGVRMGSARARRSSLVDKRMHVGESGSSRHFHPQLPGESNVAELAGREIGERVNVARRMNDDLLMPELARERGKHVGHDPNPPSRTVRPPTLHREREDFGRRLRLTALAERAIGLRVLVERRERSGSRRPAGSDDDESTRQWVAAELRIARPAQDDGRSGSGFFANAAKRSIGIGTIMVDVRSALISSIVCR